MNLGKPFDRRTMTGGMLAAVVATRASSTLAMRNDDPKTWQSDDGALSVSWNPDVWTDISPDQESSNGLTLATDPTYGRPRYWLSLGSSDAAWTSVDDASTNAQAEWFSQGMNGSVVTDEFQSDSAYGWVHFADFQDNPRTVSVIQYELDDEGGMTTVVMSIDAGAFEALDVDDAFDAITLNDDSVFLMGSPRKVTRAIKDAFTA